MQRVVLVLTLVVLLVVAIVVPAAAQGPDADSNVSVAMAWAQKTDKKGKEKKGKETTKETTVVPPESGGMDPANAALIGLSAVALLVGVWVITRRLVDDDEAA